MSPMDDTAKAFTRSQGGSGVGSALSTCPMPSHMVGTPSVSCASSAPPPFAPLFDFASLPVWDLDLAVPNAADVRRLEVVVDGLPLFGGAQLVLDTTLMCALHSNGSARRGPH